MPIRVYREYAILYVKSVKPLIRDKLFCCGGRALSGIKLMLSQNVLCKSLENTAG